MTPTILHVIDTTGPGGAETVFLALAEGCIKQGYRSVALIRGPGWVEQQLKTRSIPYYIRDCKGSLNLRFLLEMRSIIRKEQVTHIQSHLLGSNVYTSILGLFTGLPVTATFHGHVDISPNERFRNAKLALIKLGARHVVSVTEDLKNTINQTTGSWCRLYPTVIPNGIDLSELEKLPIGAPASSDKPLTLGCLGNIRPAKNYALAIEFVQLLKSKGTNVMLRIAGDDTKSGAIELKKEVARLGLEENVEFLGFINDVPGFFGSIDVFLMTSSSEGHPLALTQALAAAKPILSTRNGVERVVPEHLLFLAHEHTAASLFAALEELLRSSETAAIAGASERLVAGRKFVKDNYSEDVMRQRYINLYEIGAA
ncbi:capsular polysaccharide biosynthesis protein [Streptosporangium jomthongense]|uniref:Glycosyltransferase family 4 protein n=1 Tax=Marinobacter aromaticivorans TaxID=1494078 RepID=A0ABW2IUC6_9GAMM|nr:glycosyltransferase family 4 protein [Marinobacter aromaticivorans]GGE61535.1 capsular polysaccharide biosynthesis protein [Streptosporangium jomthongense]